MDFFNTGGTASRRPRSSVASTARTSRNPSPSVLADDTDLDRF
jgi:hypothetical protein